MSLRERLRLEELEGQTLLSKKKFPVILDNTEDESSENEPIEFEEN